ncbi:E3 ubiquitin/ISG15 ligase TRIM25-like [Triplophysa dalaica]|uniref:E3 ubiquitin/ISG15 ligase TRIM25-like n=1 Tax=Triplophysa dalaica TaxID=1582913 RepID=UPI0024DFEF14|nr:E3 ubiquitin/ISG15 ligase TRIM25-like [Triplophysa dalaica]
MAVASISVAQDHFTCSICLDLLKNPVTIPCGHSYCMDCITNCWNQEDQKRIYSCPQCRQTFTTRPVLNKNVVFAEMVEKLKNTRLQSSHVSAHRYSESGDVECDVCTERKLKAVKSCLVCLNSCGQNQTLLFETQRKFRERIQEREKDLQELRQAVDSHKRSAQTAVEDSERIFTQLIRSIERRRSEVTQLIRDQEKTVVSRAEGVLKRLEQEIDDLRRRDTELKQFLHTDDHIHFLQSFKCFSTTPESSDVSSITVSSQLSFDEVRQSVSKLKEKLEDLCKEEIENISDRVTNIEIIASNELKTREKFLQYSSLFSLDPNTANKTISLSENNSVATYTNTVQQYPDHPDRFDFWRQVLCRESVCGRCYWEVERSGVMGISVSYKNIRRKGRGFECVFGYNDQSWRLYCTDSTCSFKHNRKQTNLPVVSSSCRIGVYVDHRAGIFSFYSVSDTMTLIHRVQTTFTQPLYLGFWIDYNSTVKLCNLTR